MLFWHEQAITLSDASALEAEWSWEREDCVDFEHRKRVGFHILFVELGGFCYCAFLMPTVKSKDYSKDALEWTAQIHNISFIY